MQYTKYIDDIVILNNYNNYNKLYYDIIFIKVKQPFRGLYIRNTYFNINNINNRTSTISYSYNSIFKKNIIYTHRDEIFLSKYRPLPTKDHFIHKFCKLINKNNIEFNVSNFVVINSDFEKLCNQYYFVYKITYDINNNLNEAKNLVYRSCNNVLDITTHIATMDDIIQYKLSNI